VIKLPCTITYAMSIMYGVVVFVKKNLRIVPSLGAMFVNILVLLY